MNVAGWWNYALTLTDTFSKIVAGCAWNVSSCFLCEGKQVHFFSAHEATIEAGGLRNSERLRSEGEVRTRGGAQLGRVWKGIV